MTHTLTTSGDRPLELVWRNVTTRYVSIGVDGVIGLLLLPFTIAHLGASEYGLWALATSVTWLFGVLDLGYGGALARFIARYRAWQDRTALNEIVSTVGCVYAALGAICFCVTLAIAWWVEALFNIAPIQVRTAQSVLLIVGAYLSIRFPFAIFGGVVYAFQRSYRNNLASILASLGVALVTVLMLRAGHGLVGLVAATTAVRALSLGAFTWNAYRVFPELQVSPWLFRRSRLHEVTGFSVYMFILDCAAKLNYSADALVIGAMLNTVAVAVWTVGQRVAQFTQQLTGQITDALFPVVVDSDAAQRQERLRAILIQGTRVSLAFAAPVCVGLIVLADPLIHAWMGARFLASVLPTQLLLGVVLVRAATSSANVILKGAGRHRLLAWTNASAAIANVVLSVSLVGPFGLTGVAIGTFVPVTLSALLVLYPAACRRVGLGTRRAVADAIWPAAWPAAVTAGVLWIERAFHFKSLIEIAVMLAIGAIVYAGLFIGVAIAREERRVYLLKLQTLLIARREPPPTPRLVAD